MQQIAERRGRIETWRGLERRARDVVEIIELAMEESDDSVETALPRDLRSLLQWVRAMSPEGPMARLPFRVIVR